MQKDFKRAKELYYANFASYMTMKKNGEFNAYRKFDIPKDVEHEWSIDVKERLIDEVRSGADLLKVVNLSRVNLPKNEIVDAFRSLAECPLRERILSTIEQMEPLFESGLYKSIVRLFSE